MVTINKTLFKKDKSTSVDRDDECVQDVANPM